MKALLLAAAASLAGVSSAVAQSCVTTKVVLQAGGGDCTSIQQCVNTIPASLAGDYCIDIRDDAAYAENPIVSGVATNGFRIYIGSLNGAHRAWIHDNTGSAAAVFYVYNSSVTLLNLAVTTPIPHEGILVSSTDAVLNGVYVNYAGGGSQQDAAISITSRTTIVNSSVTISAASGVRSAEALKVVGSLSSVSASTFTGGGSDVVEMVLVRSASSNTFTQDFLYNSSCYALGLESDASYNSVSFSTMSGSGASCAGFHIAAGTRNVVSDSFICNPAGIGALIDTIDGGNVSNSVSRSTITSGAASPAVKVDFALDLTLSQDLITSAGAEAVSVYGYLSASSATITKSTLTTSGASASALSVDYAGPVNVIASYVQGSTAVAVTHGSTVEISSSVLVAASHGGGLTLLNSSNAGVSSTTIIGGPLRWDGGSVSLATVTFQGLLAGATAIDLLQNATYVATFTAVTFADASLGVNVNGSLVDAGFTGSRLTFRSSAGPASGPRYENDPNAFIDWPGYVSPGLPGGVGSGIPGGCSSGAILKTFGGDCSTLQGCIDMIPSSLTGNYCIDIEDSATYADNPTVRNKTTNGYRIYIGSLDRSKRAWFHDNTSFAPAVFQISNASVTLMNVAVTDATPDQGIVVSSPNVTLDGVYVNYSGGGNQNDGAIAISSWTTVIRSSVSVNANSGVHAVSALKVTGTGSVVSLSTFTAAGSDSVIAVYLYSASSNTVTQTYIYNSVCYSMALGILNAGGSGSDYNTVTLSTLAALGTKGGCSSLHIGGGSYNTFSHCAISNVTGAGVLFDTIDGANYSNAIVDSTITTNDASAQALSLSGGANVALARDFVRNPSGEAVMVGGVFSIDASTIVSNAAGFRAFHVYGGAGPGAQSSLTNSYVQGSTAAYLDSVDGLLIDSSTLVASDPAGYAVSLPPGSGSVALSGDVIKGGASGVGLMIGPGNGGPFAVEQSTISPNLKWSSGGLTLTTVTFRGLPAGTTAISLIPSNVTDVYLATFTAVNFADTNIAVNVDGSLVNPTLSGSRLTMIASTGPRAGAGFENDPNSFIDWPDYVSPGLPAGCATGYKVKQDGSADFAIIQAAVNALGKNLTGDACVMIGDAQTYNEQVTVQGFTNNGYRVRILADPALGSAPVINPPAASTAAFVIANASVSVIGITVTPTNAITYGVYASSASVQISSVSVLDVSQKIATAGISITSGSAVTSSIVNAKTGGLFLNGSNSSVSLSTFTCSAGGRAISFNGASSNVVTQTYAFNFSGVGAYLDTGSNNNTISQSTLLSSSTVQALYLTGASGNAITQSYVSNPTGYGAQFYIGANNNTISLSTITSNTGGYQALSLTSGASSNTVSGSYIGNPLGYAAYLLDASYNTVVQSTVAGGGASGSVPAFYLSATGPGNAVYNTIANTSIVSPTNHALFIAFGANNNTIVQSRLTSNSAAYRALELNTVTSNTVTQSVLSNPAGYGVLVSFSAQTTISQSTVTAGLFALDVDASSDTSFTGSYAQAPTAAFIRNSTGTKIASSAFSAGATGIRVDVGNAGLLALSTVTVTGAATGLSIDVQASGIAVNVASVTFRDLTAGATAISFLGGTLVSTLTAVNFQDTTIGTDVSAAALSAASSITMLGSSGARMGPAFAVDPLHVVHWPGSVLPVSLVTAPAAPFVSALATVSGTAQAFGGATISSVSVAAANLAAGKFWNGAAFASVSPVFSTAAFSGAASGTWTYVFAGLSAALTNGTSYQIQTQAIDSLGLIQSPPSTFSFVLDAAPPAAAIVQPANGSALAVFPSIAGTAVDALSGVTLDQVQISSGPSYGMCWTGSAWGACPAFQNAVGTAAWSYSSVPGNAFLAPGTTYQITLQAVDGAGNVRTAISSFVFAGPGFCLVSTTVVAGVNTIQSALAAAGPTLAGNLCVNVNGGTYPEAVTVQGINTNGFRIVISSSVGGAPVIVPPPGAPAAVSVANASVTLQGLTIAPAAAAPYGVRVSSSGVVLSSVTVSDPGGLISNAGVAVVGGSASAIKSSFFQTSTAVFVGGGAGVAISSTGMMGVLVVAASPGTSVSIAGMVFSSLPPGATAMQLGGGVLVSTFSGVVFNDPNIGINVAAGALAAGSNVVMPGASGVRAGPGYADDPGQYVHWPGFVGPVSAVTSPSQPVVRALSSVGGTAQAFSPATVNFVAASIQDLSTGLYWDGAAFASAAPQLNPAVYVGGASGVWSYSNANLNGALRTGTTYRIQSVVVDTLAQRQLPPGSFDVLFDTAPPSAAILFPAQGGIYTSLPTVSGTSGDNVAVATVSLSVQQIGGGCLGPAGFNAVCPSTFSAQGSTAAWSFTGIPWVLGQSYLLAAMARDVAGSVQMTTVTFSVVASTSLLSGTPGDGQGAATVAPASVAGCQLLTATATYTAGPLGVAPGGVVAFHVPNGWTLPQGAAPGQPGYVLVNSSSGFTTSFNPTAPISSVTLGANWVVYNATAALAPGQAVQFSYQGYPAPGSSALGPQAFSFMTRGGAGGNLVAISSSPALGVTPGPPSLLSFAPSASLVLGPLQNSPTMQVQVWDTCGVPTSPASGVAVSLQALVGGAADAQAVFASTAGAPLSTLSIAPGAGLSPGFTFKTQAAGVLETLTASASLGGTSISASRSVQMLAAPAAISGVSVDTGTLGTAKSATIVEGAATGGAVFINFALSDPTMGWEVAISTDPVGFTPKVADFFGTGNPGRSILWNGLRLTANPPQFVPPGQYYARVIAGGGSAIDSSLAITVAPSASVFGVLTNGPGAAVTPYGPGVAPGSFAVASSTGFFQIFGLQNGVPYLIQASSSVLVGGALMNVAVSSAGAVATLAGTDLGALTFQVPSLLEVSATLPFPAPSESWGSVAVHDATYAHKGSGMLHFAAGALASDNGAQAFGASASTWTVIPMPPGVYQADVALPALGISTSVTGVAVGSAGATFLPVTLQKRVNVYGRVILPAAVAADTWVSVQARAASGASAFGGVTVPVAASSAVYSLFGLAPGTWTVTAVSPGALPAVSTVSIAGTADVGDPASGGLDLTLKAGGTLAGTITVVGDTSKIDMSATCPNAAALCVTVAGFSPTTFFNGAAVVTLSTSATQTSGSFSFGGLPDGLYYLNAHLDGFLDAGQTVGVTAGAGTSALALTASGAKLLVTVKRPGTSNAPSDFKTIALGWAGATGAARAFPDMTAGTTVQYFASSATVLFSALTPDVYQVQAFDAATGMYRAGSASVGSTGASAVVLDLSASTYPVRGTFVLASNLSLPNSAGAAVSVSSVPGLLANTGSLGYCLLGYAAPPSVPVAHLELLPAAPGGGFLSEALAPVGAGCASNLISPLNATGLGARLPNPYLAYVATISADGSFAFAGVPAGVYQLRSNAQLDLAGDRIPQAFQTVVVTGTVSGLTMQIGGGVTVAGSVLAPAGAVLSRAVTVSLVNDQSQVLGAVQASFNNSNSASYSFSQVADGRYTLLVQDPSSPKVYAASALQVQVSGQSLSGQDLQLQAAGTIKLRVAVKENMADGTQQSMLISAANTSLLPASFQIEAVSDQGAFAYAGGSAASAPPLDANGQYVIDGLLPGTYEVRFAAPASGAGAVSLVATAMPGVVVTAGSVTDIGTANLAVGTQFAGRVVDAATGLPVANILVHAQPSQRGAGLSAAAVEAATDGGGRYVLNGLNPAVRYYDLFAAYRGDETQGETLPPYQQAIVPSVDVSSVAALDVKLAPAPYSISGRLPAAATVFVQKVGVAPVRNPMADIVFQTDVFGAFSVPSLTTGAYRLIATSPGYEALTQFVSVATASVDLGALSMKWGATLSGSITRPDGTYPSQREVSRVMAVTLDLANMVAGSLTTNPNTQAVTGYSISGFKPHLPYRVILLDEQNDQTAPPEARALVFNSTDSRTLNLVYRPEKPLTSARGSRQPDSTFLLQFDMSRPMRAKTAADDDLSLILTTMSASGQLSQLSLSQDRTRLTAVYAPGVGESSFTVRLRGYSTLIDPDSADPVNPEFVNESTATFFTGLDGAGQSHVPNLQGGNVLVDGDNGRVTLQPGSFNVDVSSSVLVTLQVAKENLGAGHATSRYDAAASRLRSLRYAPRAYPSEIVAAAAAVPPSVNPLSAFYNIFLPLGVNTALARPAALTISYSTDTDPSTLNLYWYNPAANAYVLQQDAAGAAPVIDTVNHTITLNVSHFSTFVLFNSGQAVITGGTGAASLQAANFPNPFDLGRKTVTPLHAGSGACSPSCSIDGTMISVSVPPNLGGEAKIRIFNVAGVLVRTIGLGTLQGGQFYYQNWDGTNDAGRPVASGVYIGELQIDGQTAFFKMALVKGSGL